MAWISQEGETPARYNESVMELVQIEPARKLPAPKPEWLKARAPGGRELPRPQAARPGARSAHRMRERALPEHRRMLAPQDCDVHDARQPVHAALRILCGSEGTPRADRHG